jgi:hypothetical protein
MEPNVLFVKKMYRSDVWEACEENEVGLGGGSVGFEEIEGSDYETT